MKYPLKKPYGNEEYKLKDQVWCGPWGFYGTYKQISDCVFRSENQIVVLNAFESHELFKKKIFNLTNRDR